MRFTKNHHNKLLKYVSFLHRRVFVQEESQKMLIINKRMIYEEKKIWICIRLHKNYVRIYRILDYLLKKHK